LQNIQLIKSRGTELHTAKKKSSGEQRHWWLTQATRHTRTGRKYLAQEWSHDQAYVEG